jgi:hypothetical protein
MYLTECTNLSPVASIPELVHEVSRDGWPSTLGLNDVSLKSLREYCTMNESRASYSFVVRDVSMSGNAHRLLAAGLSYHRFPCQKKITENNVTQPVLRIDLDQHPNRPPKRFICDKYPMSSGRTTPNSLWIIIIIRGITSSKRLVLVSAQLLNVRTILTIL